MVIHPIFGKRWPMIEDRSLLNKRRINQIIGALLIAFVTACSTSSDPEEGEIRNFLNLLVAEREPTLADYARFAGDEDSGEIELAFEIEQCRQQGWNRESPRCIQFVRDRWSAPASQKSYFLSWVRKNFSTVGKDYTIRNIQSEIVGFHHDLARVEIGRNDFLIFRNAEPDIPTGMSVGISQINNKKVSDYLEQMFHESIEKKQ